MGKGLVIVWLGILGSVSGWSVAGAGEKWLYVSPTIGVWRWDRSGYPDLEVDLHGPVVGLRGGFAPTRAFAAELVALTGTTDARAEATDPATTLRQTLLELSLLVKFQSLAIDQFYPFLDLGVGAAIRRGGPESGTQGPVDDEQLAFHLGGGIMLELSERWALRLNVRDSFFTDDRLVGNLGDQVTVDTLEFSLGVVLGFPVGSSGPKRLQFHGFDDGSKGE